MVATAVSPWNKALTDSSTSPLAVGFNATSARPSAFVVTSTCCRPPFNVAVSSPPSLNSTSAPDTGRSLRSRTSTTVGTAVPRSMMLTLSSPASTMIRRAGSWAADAASGGAASRTHAATATALKCLNAVIGDLPFRGLAGDEPIPARGRARRGCAPVLSL